MVDSNTKRSLLPYHLMTLFTVIVWGTTYVSTKVLIEHGLSPAEIMMLRFILAYVCIWFLSPKKLFCRSWRDEGIMILLGMTGGSLYFIVENTALGITLASNVSLILCTAPLLSALLLRLFNKNEKLRSNLVYGAVLAMLGVAFVVFNGHFILKLNPLGDFLALMASLMWAFYSLLLKKVDSRYPTVLITRKVFFYGMLTILPYFIFRPMTMTLQMLAEPVIWMNLLFLAFVASLVCFILWNVAVKNIGPITATNYLYIQPIVTLITAAIAIHETITFLAIIGCVLIIGGVYVAQKRKG
jgi:drug/metabolite transporter (DMT)-like permease